MSTKIPRHPDLRSGPPVLATTSDLATYPETSARTHHDNAKSAKKPGRINLRAVAEALAEEGLDPATELIRIIQAGSLEPKVQASILNELLQYTQPKLKSIEVKGKFELTEEQIDSRIQSLMQSMD